MDSVELGELAAEMLDEDLPGVSVASINNGRLRFIGKLDRDYIETEQVTGVRSVFVCSAANNSSVSEGAEISISGVDYTIEAIEQFGIAFIRLILGRYQ